MTDTATKRKNMIDRLFPTGFPKIWCPALTHYTRGDEIYYRRIDKHIDFITPYINSFLIQGSTGDGWEFTFEEFKSVVDNSFKRLAEGREINILVGLLNTNIDRVMSMFEHCLSYFRNNNIAVEDGDGGNHRFKGFVICPPKGKEKSQDEMIETMEKIVIRGFPVALYQLPQISENLMTPYMVKHFSSTYHNCFLLKDSSGADMIANADEGYDNLVLVRGAEGNYSQMLKKSGGKYDGFLLSIANTFPKELSMLVENIENGKQDEAEIISNQLTETISKILDITKNLPFGNPFTNSNKLIDHIKAFGDGWQKQPSPLLHSGDVLPRFMVEQTASILRQYDLYPIKGYFTE